MALVSVVAIMIILLAVLALVVVKALAESPWGLFTIVATMPIAMIMGAGLRPCRSSLGSSAHSAWRAVAVGFAGNFSGSSSGPLHS